MFATVWTLDSDPESDYTYFLTLNCILHTIQRIVRIALRHVFYGQRASIAWGWLMAMAHWERGFIIHSVWRAKALLPVQPIPRISVSPFAPTVQYPR